MDKTTDPTYTTHPIVVLDLPLQGVIRIVRPDQIVLKIGMGYHDLGSYCYALRSAKKRKKGRSREVDLSSFLKNRPKQIRQLVKALDRLRTDGGQSLESVFNHASAFKRFIDWADANAFFDCLAGGEKTKQAYEAWCAEVHDSYKRHELGARARNSYIAKISCLLESMTGVQGLSGFGWKVATPTNFDSFTEPAQELDFAHVLALNQALFDGLCSLLLENQPFPYQLHLPKSLGWKDSFLWLFPECQWCLPPHLWGEKRESRTKPRWAYDFEHGRLATVDEIAHRYKGRGVRRIAEKAINVAQSKLDKVNRDERHWVRTMLGMHAHNAFMFLFFANTGCNESVAREIETDGKIDPSTLNQHFRSIKFRAGGKLIKLVAPVVFMPTLRRFMELRRWLLNGADFPYLFFSLSLRLLISFPSAKSLGTRRGLGNYHRLSPKWVI